MSCSSESTELKEGVLGSYNVETEVVGKLGPYYLQLVPNGQAVLRD